MVVETGVNYSDGTFPPDMIPKQVKMKVVSTSRVGNLALGVMKGSRLEEDLTSWYFKV